MCRSRIFWEIRYILCLRCGSACTGSMDILDIVIFPILCIVYSKVRRISAVKPMVVCKLQHVSARMHVCICLHINLNKNISRCVRPTIHDNPRFVRGNNVRTTWHISVRHSLIPLMVTIRSHFGRVNPGE